VTLEGALDALRAYDIQLFKLGEAQITALSLLKLLVLVTVLFWLSAWVRRLTIERALRHTPLHTGTRQAVGSMVRYLVLLIGLVVILQNAGINLSALSVVAGAVGVGVGFGLQNIVSNFVSGVILMVERPIKVGDRVEVAGIEGTVRDIGARRTTVVTHDNIAILVPNQRFILDNVVNLVYAETRIRLRVPVHVQGDADPARVEQALLDAARTHPDVLKEPPPRVLRPSLGGAALHFELCVWHEALGPVRQHLSSDLNTAVDKRLSAAGIRYA
jgi:small-conductance mechanosensitive channel